jgi:hypothetical protein
MDARQGGREAGETSAQVLRNSKWEFVVKVSEAVQEGQDEEETRRRRNSVSMLAQWGRW